MYNKEYYKKNKDRYREYHAKNRARILKQQREFRKNESPSDRKKREARVVICHICQTVLKRQNFRQNATCDQCKAEQKRLYARKHPSKRKETDYSIFWEAARKRVQGTFGT